MAHSVAIAAGEVDDDDGALPSLSFASPLLDGEEGAEGPATGDCNPIWQRSETRVPSAMVMGA